MSSGDDRTRDSKLPTGRRISTEKFLEVLLEHAADENHKRLLKACRPPDPLRGMENELSCIIQEICDET